jgi:putative ABC transport system permease protein
MLDTTLKDLRFAFRSFLKRPTFAAIAVITLALGIGANSAIFSVVNSIVLRPLPYEDSSRLVVLWGNLHNNGLDEVELSAPEYVDLQNQCQSFDNLAAYAGSGFNLSGVGEAERLRGSWASANLFSTLGTNAALGRTFLKEEDQFQHDQVVLLSYALWQRRFGADPSIVNQSITIDGQSVRVVGIMPAGFQFPEKDTELWRPLALDPELLAEDNRGSHFLNVIGRLRSGVNHALAQAELDLVSARLSKDHSQQYKSGFTVAIRSLQEEKVGGNLRKALYILLATVGLLLAVSCANVAHLLLANAAGRHREIAVRLALGASRRRVIRQFLTESLLLSAVGGFVGLTLAVWGVRLLVALIPKDTPRVEEIGLDYRVVLFTIAVSVVTGVLFGLAPALQASKSDLNETLKQAGRSAGDSPSRQRLRSVLVVSEFALALVLLIGAGLMVKSFRRLQEIDPGFEPTKLLTTRLVLSEAKYKKLAQGQTFFETLFDRVRSHPEVKSIGAINLLPFGGGGGDRSFLIEGQVLANGDPGPDEQVRFITPGYFKTLEIPLLKGRDIDGRDVSNAPQVMVVNQALARKFWPNEDAIGKRISFSNDPPNWYQIVGVVGNVKHRGLEAAEKPELYVPIFQPLFPDWNMPPMYVAVRTAGEPQSITGLIRNEVVALDPDQPISNVLTMEQRISDSVAPRRFNMFLLTLFAGLAVLLSAVGIYGIMAFSVTQRTQEIGVRMALGARNTDVFRMVVTNGFKLALIGVAVGLGASYALTRLMASLLFEVSATDPTIFLVDALLLLTVSLLACYIPARRATRVDPLVALRNE